MRTPHFEIFRGRDKQWYFRVRASNGKIVCQSEGYTRQRNCYGGIKAVLSARIIT